MSTRIIQEAIYETSCNRCRSVIVSKPPKSGAINPVHIRVFSNGTVANPDIDLCIECTTAFYNTFMRHPIWAGSESPLNPD